MSSRSVLLLMWLLLAVACDSGDAPAPQYKAPVVVFAAADAGYLESLFAGFTEATGIPVTVRVGESATLTAEVIANRGPQRADVLLTDNVADIWRAADEGALRPIDAGNMTRVAEFLRDPDGAWTAFGMSANLIVASPAAGQPAPTSYAELAQPAFSGRLCLTTSSRPANRALIAMLIADVGLKPAERIARGWVRNLALPVFESQEAMLEAVEAGSCEYAIVSSPRAAVARILPRPTYVDIEGIGIGRHASNPDSASQLVNWLLSADVQTGHASATMTHPALENLPDAPIAAEVSRSNVGIAGWRDNDAVLLAERAGYR